MVMKMNKTEFINKLEEELKYDREKCSAINSVIEDTFIFGRHKKEKMVEKFTQELKMSNEEAEHVYEVVSSIISKGIKDGILHPFRSKD